MGVLLKPEWCALKKLVAAARHWAIGGKHVPNPEQEAQDESDRKAFGCCASDIDSEDGSLKDFELWPENLESFTAFRQCNTQWRWKIVGTKLIYTGLDYQGVRMVLWGLKLKDARSVFNDIRVMEEAAIEAYNQEG
ncbi:MAG: hypothetical protein C0406_00645 [Sideroxydans sp.]|nr:hypothetical protein [Sideroxydans sp.]